MTPVGVRVSNILEISLHRVAERQADFVLIVILNDDAGGKLEYGFAGSVVAWRAPSHLVLRTKRNLQRHLRWLHRDATPFSELLEERGLAIFHLLFGLGLFWCGEGERGHEV